MSRRPSCGTCLRAQSACICRWITPVANQVEVLILQHPLEQDQAKGSARLLHLSLARSRMLTGEAFDAQAWLPTGNTRRNILLYPDFPSDRAAGLPPPPALAPDVLQDPSLLRLIVLDGTWRKSRKMLYVNPSLQRLPRLSLQDLPVSNYRIRRAHRPEQLSTLEAV
ncbi:tRNA-uridine aminocarboxypropyltransferase, partial [Polaromonas sp.]|uniref:tRNA-uridine aminocarboxypropyltransferase n=1 Tax=Polaromonas sp. TaxID=1869339 RepID=UPI0037537094